MMNSQSSGGRLEAVHDPVLLHLYALLLLACKSGGNYILAISTLDICA